MQQIAVRIKEQMQASGTSVVALSAATAIPRMTLTRRLADPSSLTVAEIAKIVTALNMDARELLGDVA